MRPSRRAIPSTTTSAVKARWVQAGASFVRLYMVPGMQHCFGGAGANNFGQLSVASGDADHDIDVALERWVETGVAPERIVATKHKNDMDPNSPWYARGRCAPIR